MLQSPFKLPMKLIVLFLLGWFLLTDPMGFAQGVGGPRSPVVVDGIPLFNLQPVDRFTAFERTQFANNLLSDAISNERVITFDVRNDPDNRATSISLNKNYLLTVTANTVYVFARFLGDQEIVIAVNVATESANISFEMPSTDRSRSVKSPHYKLLFGQGEFVWKSKGETRHLELMVPARSGLILGSAN